MVIMTLIFGGSGIYLFVEGLGLLILRPAGRQGDEARLAPRNKQKGEERSSKAA